MKNLRFYTDRDIPLALSNLISSRTNHSTADIRDACEDSQTGSEFLNRLNQLRLLDRLSLDRETPTYVRIKVVDCWGNVSYLRAAKE